MVLTLPSRRPFPLALQASHPHPRKVAAWTATLGLHAAVLLLVLTPPAPMAPFALPAVAPDPIVVWIEPTTPVEVPLLPEPTRPTTEPLRPTLASPLAPDLVRPTLVESTLALETASIPAVPGPVIDTGPGAPDGILHSEAIAIARVTPPAYPGPALRRGLEGTVELLVLVGSDGRPRRVEVVASSGHRDLDRAARAHVLAEWRFHPALREGRAVEALARVPIEFRIER